jgi:hypothetical protein
MRLIIAGSRAFNNYEQLKKCCDEVIALNSSRESPYCHEGCNTYGCTLPCPGKGRPDITIISGTARGADQLGEYYAMKHGYNIERYPAEWDKYGRSAGYKRNEQMARIATHLMAFWDGKSRGTQHMIDLARKYKLKVSIALFNQET